MKPIHFFLILALVLGGCLQALSPTPVPISTWIAEGVPEDTVVRYESIGAWGNSLSVMINADGFVDSTIGGIDGIAHGTGEITQDELKQILRVFEEADFFSLHVDEKGYLYNGRHPPTKKLELCATDAPWVTISISLHGISKSLHYYDCIGYLPDMTFFRSVEKLTLLGERVATEFKPYTPTP